VIVVKDPLLVLESPFGFVLESKLESLSNAFSSMYAKSLRVYSGLIVPKPQPLHVTRKSFAAADLFLENGFESVRRVERMSSDRSRRRV